MDTMIRAMAIEDKKPYYCDYDVIERYFKEK